ncbi:MAG TPA: hypothetical protein VGN51_07295 [Acidimicrobiia bacterium]|jgi:hypothetical protein
MEYPRDGEPGGSPCHACAAPDTDYLWVDDEAAAMGRMIVRLERAVQAVGGIARVHVNRWGDGGSHFHLWFYGRPLGDPQMIGFCLPLWAMTLPPTPDDEWNRNLTVIADELSQRGGRSMR